MKKETREKNVEKTKNWITEFARLVIGVSLIFLVVVSFMLMAGKIETHGANAGKIILALVVAYMIFSFRIIHQGEVGMMSVLGTPKKNVGPGFYFTPAGLVQIRIVAGTMFQDELPADSEKIFRGDGAVPDGMFPPIRVKFGQPGPTNGADPEENKINTSLKEDPYNVAMVAEVVPVACWNVDNPMKFFATMGSIENCKRILTDKTIETFGDEFAKMTPARAMLKLKAISEGLEKTLEKEAEEKDWGIKINDAYVKPIIFTHELNTAVVKVSVAQQNAKAVIHEAEGNAKAVKITANAEKMRLTTTGLAKTDNTGKIIELIPDAHTRVSAEAIKELSKVTGTLVLGQGVTPVINLNRTEEKSITSPKKEKDVKKAVTSAQEGEKK